MALVEKSALIDCSAAQMFELVDRVEDYPQFLPWCGGSAVQRRDAEVTVATIDINYHGIRQSFSTENAKLFPDSINMKLLSGPFQALDGRWLFRPLDDQACKIEFRLHYEFSSRALALVINPVFSHIANTFVTSFVQRAKQVYGPGKR